MKRIGTAVVLLVIVVGAVLYAPQWIFAGVLALIGLAAFHEFEQVAAAQGIARSGLAGMATGLAAMFAPEPLAVLVLTGLVAMTFALHARDLAQCLPAASSHVLGVLYIFGALRCAVGLREINPHWLMIALLVSWVGDTAALYVGRNFGKHKLAPRISPAKTWEGAAGSVVGGTLAAGVYAYFLIPPAPLAPVLGLAAAANIAGQAGDLCESAFKRGAGLKDSGRSLPGHGGWLDRIDSSLFSVPVVYAVLRYILR
jgi:phosphatidate cytidylyltransferase